MDNDDDIADDVNCTGETDWSGFDAYRKADGERQAFNLDNARLYFIEARSARLIKIGYSRDLDLRFAGLQSASAVPLKLLGSVRGNKPHERALHQHFAAARMRGEWFASAVIKPFVVELLSMDEDAARAVIDGLISKVG